MRRLAVDPGAKRVGLAWSDHDVSIALPLKTLSAVDHALLLKQLRAEIEALAIDEVIVGLPLQMDGREAEGARRSRKLAAQIEQLSSARVVLWDERLTTVAAQRSLRDSGVGSRDQKSKIDQAAATILLQSYLDSFTETSWDAEPPQLDAPVATGSRRKKNYSRER